VLSRTTETGQMRGARQFLKRDTSSARILPMLPDFPRLKGKLERVSLAKLRRRVDSGDPVLSQIRRMRQHEGRSFSHEQLGGTKGEGEAQEFQSKFEISFAEVPGLTLQKLDQKLDELAQSIIPQQAKYFFERVGEECEKVGNSMDAKGERLSASMLLDMMSKVQTDFDADGKPGGMFVIHPSLAPAVQKAAEELENDPELKRRGEEIQRRQREEWSTRESNRRLVD
jgi:hypothetical protein